MSDGVLLGVFASFVLIGTVGIAYYILLKILHPRSNGRYIVVIPARSGMTDVAGRATLSGFAAECSATRRRL